MEREDDSFEGNRRPLHDVGEPVREDDPFEGNRRSLQDVGQPVTETAPQKRYRPYQRVLAGIGGGCLVIVVGFALLFIVASICAPSDNDGRLPAYTPTPADIDAAYAKGLADVEEAIESFDEIYPTAIRDLNAIPQAMDDALREALSCKVHINALADDPREETPSWALAPPELNEVRNTPYSVINDLAAARVASPENRDLIDEADSDARWAHLRANMKNGKYVSPGYDYTKDPNIDPILRAYYEYSESDSALNAYKVAAEEQYDAYDPVVHDILRPARSVFVLALIEAPTMKDCQGLLLLAFEEYMHAYEVHRAAFVAYWTTTRVALETYLVALRDERRQHASGQ